jgi:hypothetical protein
MSVTNGYLLQTDSANTAHALARQASQDSRPAFLITVDTECDDAWSPEKKVSTLNARFLARFQSLCESYGLQPTYLTAFEMASSSEFKEFGRDLLLRGKAEIGMHLHAWNSPPLVPLTANDNAYHPYLTEYPEAVMREKIAFLTDFLEDTFGEKMTAHRGGRWAFNKTYARLLIERGYLADCSVTPGISWASHRGDPAQRGGPDYTHFPMLPYFLDLDDLSRPGDSGLLEIPVTSVELQARPVRALVRGLNRRSLAGRVMRRAFPTLCWLAPTKQNMRHLLRVIKKCRSDRPCVQLALHSSNFMPGGSPFFKTERDVEGLYECLNEIFSFAGTAFRASTVTHFRNRFAEA